MSIHAHPIADAPAINFAAVAHTARSMADRVNPRHDFNGRANALRHIAADAECALGGCESSAASVIAFIDGEHELEMAADQLELAA